MCARLTSLFSVALMLTLASATHGVVISDFEDGLDGWTAEGAATLSNSTTGATSGSQSLQIDDPTGGIEDVAKVSLLGVLDDYLAGDTIEMDVTYDPADWTGQGAWANFEISISSENGGRIDLGRPDTDNVNPGYTGGWDPTNFPDLQTRHVTWDVSETHAGLAEGPGASFDLFFITNFDEAFTNGTYYVDNVEITTRAADTGGGLVIGDWEDEDMEGWEICDLDPPGDPTFSYNATGATLGDSSLRMAVTNNGWKFVLFFKLQSAGLTEEFFSHNIFSIDVTRLVEDWIGADGFTELILIVNSDDLFEGPGAAGSWSPSDGDSTQTVSWDYSAFIPRVRSDFTYLEFVIVANCSDEYPTGGVYYLDNARLLGTGNLKAHEPSPQDGATDVRRDPVLGWNDGLSADTHEVYFGTDFNDVNDANMVSHPNVTVTAVDVNSFAPGILEFDTTYYWRVDEVNDTDVWKGLVWNFTVGKYLIIDDMESYNGLLPDDPNSNRIWTVWKEGFGYGSVEYPPIYCGNGSGASVGDIGTSSFTEETIVHGGAQAMPYYYANDGSGTNNCGDPITLYYSESQKTMTSQRDWTEADVETLSLWFIGDPCNAAEQLYVAVANSTGPPVVVNHRNPGAAQVADWQEWNIKLSRFEDGGIDLTDVNSLVIGFGDRDDPQLGGLGKVIFDDIRLYTSRCVLPQRSAEFAKVDFAPAGLPAGDCVIDDREIEIMARDWLAVDEVVATTEPGTAGLVAYYPLDEGVDTTTADASGNNHDGTLSGGLSWAEPGVMDSAYAVNMDGSEGSRISIGTWNPAEGTGQLTLATWIRWAGPRDPHRGQPQGLICKRDGWSSARLMFMLEMDTPDEPEYRGSFALRQYSGADTDVYSETGIMTPFIGTWAHVAATFDGTTARLYLNGEEVASGPFSFANGTDADMTIGNNNSDAWPNCPGAFNGILDEVRIYNRALLAAQIAYLADATPGDGQLHVPVPSAAELYEGEAPGSRSVNFRDFAVLADRWLDDEL